MGTPEVFETPAPSPYGRSQAEEDMQKVYEGNAALRRLLDWMSASETP